MVYRHRSHRAALTSCQINIEIPLLKIRAVIRNEAILMIEATKQQSAKGERNSIPTTEVIETPILQNSNN